MLSFRTRFGICFIIWAFPFATSRFGSGFSGFRLSAPLLHYAFTAQLLGDSLKTVHWTVFALLRSAVPYVPQRLRRPYNP